MEKIDKDLVLDSIELLPKQIEQAWGEGKNIKFSKTYQTFSDVTVCGMGGSALGADVLRSLFGNQMRVPFVIVSDYHLPGYVGKDSLVILSSYSGNTEEVLSCSQIAKRKKAKIAVITCGGKLKELAKKNKWPSYVIKAEYNPSKQPRMALGYAAFGLSGMFSSLGLIKMNDTAVHALTRYLTTQMQQFGPDRMNDNPAKQIAEAAEQRMLILMSAEHMLGPLHVMNNQINENAKHLCIHMPIPEINHHFLEALSKPDAIKKQMLAVLFQSPFYLERTQKRIQLTADLLAKNGILPQIVNSTARTPMEQAWEAIHMGSYTSFYLSMLHGINPAPVPNVETFKQKLAE